MTLTTGADGRAEIQPQDGSVARISPTARSPSARCAARDPADTQMDVNSGLAYFELQGNGESGQISVRFAGSTVTTSGFTILRVNQDNPPGDLAVFRQRPSGKRLQKMLSTLNSGKNVPSAPTTPTVTTSPRPSNPIPGIPGTPIAIGLER